jgi:DNA (cytosine-5)-methyltransferase 1
MGLGFSSFFNIQYAVDKESFAVKTYQANHPDCQVKQCDVGNVSGARGDFNGVAGVIGGPPCQPYSLLNLKKDLNDPRRKLTGEFMRLVGEIKPRFFVLENVPYTPTETKHMVAKVAGEFGYYVTSVYVNAADFGAAQYRKRWIAVGVKGKRWSLPLPCKPLTVRDAFSGVRENWGLMQSKPEKLKQLENTVVGEWRSVSNGAFKNGIRLSWDMPSPAVVNLQKVYMVHPEELRNISLAEAAALQGFPCWYVWLGNKRDVGQMIANAMPVQLAYMVAQTLA